MLSKRRCPHTGVVNFFFNADPHVAVGSVVKGAQAGYLWRCYAEPCETGGHEDDVTAAERRVIELCHRVAFENCGRWFDAA
jgi:hypothetical protein